MFSTMLFLSIFPPPPLSLALSFYLLVFSSLLSQFCSYFLFPSHLSSLLLGSPKLYEEKTPKDCWSSQMTAKKQSHENLGYCHNDHKYQDLNVRILIVAQTCITNRRTHAPHTFAPIQTILFMIYSNTHTHTYSSLYKSLSHIKKNVLFRCNNFHINCFHA